ADEQCDADPERRPERLRREPRRALLLSGAGRPGQDRGRSVGEEVEDRECAGEHRPGETERRDLRPAEVPDDRRVCEDVQRLGCERAERRQCKAADLAVVGRAKTHRVADDNGRMQPSNEPARESDGGKLRLPYGRAARMASGVLFVAGIGALLWWRHDSLAAIGTAFGQVRWEWVVFAIALNLLSVIARVLAWGTVIHSAMKPPHPRLPLVFSAFSVGLFANA